MIFTTNGMGDLVPAVIPILPDPVLTPDQVSAMRAATAGGMGRLGCGDCGGGCGGNGMNNGLGKLRRGMGIPGVMTFPELAFETQQGRDVEYTAVGLAGLGDWLAADVGSQPGMATALETNTNGLVNALSQARGHGVGAIATDSLSDFVSSVETGSSTLLGITLPNYVWVGGGALLLALLSGAHKGRR